MRCTQHPSELLAPLLLVAGSAFGQEVGQPPDTSVVPFTPYAPYIVERDGRIDRESIPMLDAAWTRFMVIDAMNRHDMAGLFLAHQMTFDETMATAFIDYARYAIEDMRSLGSDRAKDVCGKRERLTTASALLTELLETERQEEERRKAHVEGLSAILDPVGVQRIMMWADEARSTMSMSTVDLELKFALEPQDPKAILNRMCAPKRGGDEHG
jgi:hypothetical protein